ncbi:MAG: glycosyltransferase family 39 protein [Candidatus Solibacter sp.]
MLFSTSAPPTDTAKTVADRIAFGGALLFAAFFLATSIYISTHRLFWFDEVFTTLTTRMPDWHTIWRALTEDNSDPSAFGFFIVARIFDQIFGPSELGIRLPSTLAMIAGMFITYDCARRLTNNLHGLIAMTVLTCSYLTYYGYEGRSYALFFMFASAALWAWIGRRSPVLLAVIFASGVLVHYYLILCLVPFALEEACDWRPWRLPSARLVSAASGALLGLALLSPQILRSTQVHGTAWWAAPVGRQVPSVFNEIFPPGLFLLAMAIVWISFADSHATATSAPISSAERTAWFSVLIPIAGYVIAKLVTHAFLNRYFIGMLPGVAVGFSCLVWRRYGDNLRVSVGILLLLGGYSVTMQTLTARHPEKIEAFGSAQERTKGMLDLEAELAAHGARYIVLDVYDLRFLEARYYTKHPERYVVWWSLTGALPHTPYYPFQRWLPSDVLQHAHEALFVDLQPERVADLQRFGLQTSVYKSGPLFVTIVK